MTVDERILRVARTWGHSPGAERAVARFSALGEHGRVWLAIGVVGELIDRPRRGEWRRARRTVMRAYLANTAIKLVVRRHRPRLADLPALTGTPTALSFPSAHASTSFAGAASYARLGLPALGLYALAGALSASRLYLGVHYPSDTLAGALLGTVLGRRFARTVGDRLQEAS